MEFNQEQIIFLGSLEYLSEGEKQDLIRGFTDVKHYLVKEDLKYFKSL